MKRHIGKIFILAIAVIMLCSTLCSCGLLTVAVAGAALSEGNETEVNNVETTTKATTTKTTAKAKTVYEVGETYTIKNKGTVTYNKCGEYISDNMFIVPDEGNKFIYFEFTFENTSSSEKYFSYDFSCYADGIKVNRSYYIENDLYIGDNIGAGRKVIGNVCFEVPINAEVIELEFEPSYNTTIIFKG